MNTLYFRENAGDFGESEVLAHMISFVARGQNASELAERLIDSFGSLSSVLSARPEQLRTVEGIGEKTADFIASMIGVVRAWNHAQIDKTEVISNATLAGKYIKSFLAGARTEEFWVIALNARCKVLGKRRIATGSLSEVNAYPRLIVETALNYNAHSVMLCHNHPGGTCAPSPEDISSTVMIQRVLESIGICVLDHFILAGDVVYSMIQHGDINYRGRR